MIYIVDLYAQENAGAFISTSYLNDNEVEVAIKAKRLDAKKKYIYIKTPERIDNVYRKCKIGYLDKGVVDLGGPDGSSFQNKIYLFMYLNDENRGPKYTDSSIENILLNYTERHELDIEIKVYKSEDYEHRDKGILNSERLHFLVTFSTETNAYVKEKKKYSQ